jgi:hypothetical protein
VLKDMAVPGFEPGSSGPQPLMLTTTLYHLGENRKHEDNPIVSSPAVLLYLVSLSNLVLV